MNNKYKIFRGDYMSNPIAIWGAGNRGKQAFEILHRYGYQVVCFIDNDADKKGKKLYDLPIVSYEEIGKDVIIFISICDCEAIIAQINGERKFCTFEGENTFFNKGVKENIDKILIDEFLNQSFNSSILFEEYSGNWYRKSYFNENNKNLINEIMVKGNSNVLNSDIYDRIYEDEYFENRCGAHLIYFLVNKYCEAGKKILDIGAGHGFMLDEIKKEHNGKYELWACEGSPQRANYLKEKKYITFECEAENLLGIADECIDAVICMETLEHVRDIERSVLEIKRVLKKGGICWITVPEGALCDCQTHVRHFTKNSLGWLFYSKGFYIDNILNIPANYTLMNGHMLMQCRKE